MNWMRCAGGVALSLAGMLATGSAMALDPGQGVKATTLLETDSSWDGHKLAYPDGPAKVTGMIIEVAPGAQTGWHTHSVPSFAYILQGRLEITRAGGQSKLLQAGDTLAEVVGVAHNGRNVGDEPVRLVVFYTGVQGSVLSAKAPAP